MIHALAVFNALLKGKKKQPVKPKPEEAGEKPPAATPPADKS
ncbi:MAG: hypothetical protein AB7M12_07410 [Hyphomonadaceae bacterium]